MHTVVINPFSYPEGIPFQGFPRSVVISIRLLSFVAFVVYLVAGPSLEAQAGKPTPDLLVFVNGEQLTGTLEKADEKTITFKSAMAGEITVAWTNVKELHSSQTFALLKPKMKLTRKDALASVQEGAVSAQAEGKTVAVSITSPSSTQTVPVGDLDRLIPTAEFARGLQPTDFPGMGRNRDRRPLAGARH